MEHSRSWEANSCSGSQISSLLPNPICITINFNIIFPLTPSLWSGLSLQIFRLELSTHSSSTSCLLHSTSILLDLITMKEYSYRHSVLAVYILPLSARSSFTLIYENEEYIVIVKFLERRGTNMAVDTFVPLMIHNRLQTIKILDRRQKNNRFCVCRMWGSHSSGYEEF
jgi:hypothetical protein